MRTLNKYKFNIFIVNLNLIIFFVGFPVFTTIFYGGEGPNDSTSSMTMGYRLFTLLLAFLVILLNHKFPRLNKFGKLFLFLWIAYIIRIIFDLYVRDESFYFSTNQKLLHLNGSLVSSFIPMIATFFSYKKIIWIKVFYSLLFLLTFCTLFGLLNITKDLVRFRMNVAQNTLAFGFYSAATSLAALTLIRSNIQINNLIKFFLLLIIFIGLLGIGFAGSRGPFFGFVFAVLLTPILELKPKTIFIILFLFLIFYFFDDLILGFLQDNFSVLFSRTTETIMEGDMSEREYIFQDALAQIKSHPILGDWHLLYVEKNGIGNGAHNIFLATFMSLGLFIGSIIVFLYIYFIKIAIKLIAAKNTYSFIGYLTLLCISYSLTTGGDLPYKETFNFAFGMLILTTISISKISKKLSNNSLEVNIYKRESNG